MSKFSNTLSKRLETNKNQTKATSLAKKSAKGELNSFSAVFGNTVPSEKESDQLKELLEKYASKENINISKDLDSLLSITSEVKAITNQAALLHGERIKEAQRVLKNYREGAFSAWMTHTYGNRQTPYNFLQYYEFYNALPTILHSKIKEMPRQAIYTLASRPIPIQLKQNFVEKYQGESKNELLSQIRETFPLEDNDKRKSRIGETLLKNISLSYSLLTKNKKQISSKEMEKIKKLVEALSELIKE